MEMMTTVACLDLQVRDLFQTARDFQLRSFLSLTPLTPPLFGGYRS